MKLSILLSLLVISLIIKDASTIKNKFDYYQMIPFTNTRDMTCDNLDLKFKVKVETRDLEDGVMATWTPRVNTIYFDIGVTDINTISHESYHVVQTMSQRYNLIDEELGAYMQGGLTECINNLINK